jgi:DNA-binding PadR family transcriptional regulator
VKQLTEAFRKELVQRIVRNLLDVQILRLIRTEPMWGYRIKKQAEAKFGVKLRHGALYPLLKSLEEKSFVTSQKQQQKGRTRKTYTITQKGEQYLDAYQIILKGQIEERDLE